ncbi:WG repeat-containing protein, partial [Nostoc sp. NIES-2111]
GFSEGLASVKTESGKWGFINRQGNIVIKPQFDEVSNFSFGLARVRIGKKYGYIDKYGKYVWNLSN